MHKIRKGQQGISLNPYDFVPNYSQQFSDSTYTSQLRLPMLLQTSQDLNTQLEGVVQGSKALQEIPRTLPSTVNEKNTNKSSFSDKFQNSTFGKNFGAWNAGLNAGNQIMTGIVGDQMFKGPKGNLTQAIDQGWNVASDIAMKFGPYGQMVGLAMKGLNIFNKGVNAALGSAALDNMTTTDAILNNPLTGWNVGLVNALGGKNADTITKDEEVQENIGSSYTGSFAKIDDALTKSGKRYGLFSGSALDKANQEISEAKRQQEIMTGISDYATDRFAIRNSMSAINGNRRAFAMQGGYNQAAIRAGRHGLSIQSVLTAKRVISALKFRAKPEEKPTEELQPVDSFQQGGILELTLQDIPEKYLEPMSTIEEVTLDDILPEFKDGGTIETNEISPIEYAIQRFPILASLEPIRLQYDPNFNPREDLKGNYGDIEYIEQQYDTIPYYNNYPKLDENKGKSTIVYNDNVDNEAIALDWLSHGLREHDENWRELLKLLSNDPIWKHRVIDALFGNYLNNLEIKQFDKLPDTIKMQLEQEFNKLPINEEQFNSEIDGLIRGILTNNRNTYGPIEDYQDLIKSPAWKIAAKYLFGNDVNKYAVGGKFNVIPEGALHARLHHMENDENITKKGIPVVSVDENGELEQHAEIEKEEIILRLSLTKRLEELAKEDTDEAALEAGKILVEEILNNTVDNTELLNTIN